MKTAERNETIKFGPFEVSQGAVDEVLVIKLSNGEVFRIVGGGKKGILVSGMYDETKPLRELISMNVAPDIIFVE